MIETLILAAAEPTYDGAYWLGLLSRVAHTTCGATLLGGLIYLRFVLAPAITEADQVNPTAYAGRRKTWAMCVAVCSLLLLLSGFYNFFKFIATYENLSGLYHPLFGVKFLLALGVMAITALVAGKTKLAERMQASLTYWLNLALVMALAVFVLGAVLRSYRDVPDARDKPEVLITGEDGMVEIEINRE